MRSTGNRRAIIVGIFIFLGLGIFIWTVLTLGSQKKTFGNSITIKSFFENVNGLQKGNNVWFSGVKVGTIKKVDLIGNGRVEVDMNIDEQSLPYIRKNAKARLSTDEMMNTLSKNNDNLLAITANFKTLSNQLVAGKGSIGKLLTDETFANELDKTVITLKMASANLEKLSANASAYTAKLNDKGTLATSIK